jgi:hypothetical protein
MNPIQIENQCTSTGDWKLDNPPDIRAQYPPGDLDRETNRCPPIEGYAWPLSGSIGETISFYVNTTSSTYSLQIFRLGYYNGKGGRTMHDACGSLSVGGSQDPKPPPVDGGDASNWKPVVLDGSPTFQIPLDWVSGCFVAKLQESGGKQSYIFFLVRDDTRPSDLLM